MMTDKNIAPLSLVTSSTAGNTAAETDLDNVCV